MPDDERTSKSSADKKPDAAGAPARPAPPPVRNKPPTGSKPRSVPPPPPPNRSGDRSVAPPPPRRVAKGAAVKAAKPLPVPGAERPKAVPPPGKAVPPQLSRASSADIDNLLGDEDLEESVAERAEHKPTRIGVAPAPDPRSEIAQLTLAALESQLKGATDPLKRGRLHYEIARLCESPIGDLGRAAEQYQKAYQMCPDHVPTLRGTRRVLLENRDFASAITLFDAEARFTGQPPARAVLLYEKGRVLEDGMGKKREAHEAYVAALELDPTLTTALKAVERLDLTQENWASLDSTYEREASGAGEDKRLRAAIVAERAHLAENRNDDPHAAAELYKEALGFDDAAPGAIDALKRLFSNAKRYRDLADTLQTEALLASDPTVRSMAFYRMGRVLVDRLGHDDEAVTAFERAAESAPDELLVLSELARLYERTKKHAELVQTLKRMVEKTEGVGAKLGIHHRIGQIYEEHLSDENQACESYAAALALDAAYLPALSALGDLHTRRREWQALIAMHAAEAEAVDDAGRRAAAHARIAVICEEQLGQTDAAVSHHARALGLSPMHPPSFKALCRLYATAGQHRELGELYERAVDAAKDPETKITYLFKIGRLQEDALGSPSGGLSAYRRVLEVDPEHVGALHAMQRAAERAGRYKDLVLALELEAKIVDDVAMQVALLHRAGEVLEDHLGDVDAAVARFSSVVAKDPRYAPALSSLGRLYYRAGRWDELLDVYGKELSITPKGPQSAALLYKMAELAEERMGRDDDAIAYYRRAIEMDPFHQPALHALGRKLADRGHWAELVKLIELELSGLKNEEQRVRTCLRLGEVYESKLAQNDKALAAYDQALGVDPGFRPALDGRARLLSLAKDWKRYVEELEREVAGTADPTVAVRARFRQAEILRDHLDDDSGAIECFEDVLKRDPSHIGALRALEPLFSKLGHFEGLAKVYTQQAAVLTDVGAKVAALRELSRLQESRGAGGIDALRGTFISILQLAPSDLGALAELERIALSMGDAQLLTHVDAKLGATSVVATVAAAHQTRLAEMLEAIGDDSALESYRAALARDPESMAAAWGIVRLAKASGDADQLERASDVASRSLDDNTIAAELLRRAADVHAGRGNVDSAVAALEKALDLNPNDEGVASELERLLLALDKVDRLFDILCQAAQWATDLERRAALWIRVANLLAEKKNDLPAGLSALHRVIDEQPGHVGALMQLGLFYSRDRQWAEAVDRFGQVLAQSPAKDVKIAAHSELARILQDHLGDEARALVSVERVLALDDKNRGALIRMATIQKRRGEHGPAAETAARLVAIARDDHERAEALCALAILEREQKAFDRAAHAYEQAVAFVGLDGRAAQDFHDLLVEQKLLGDDPHWENYVGALRGYLENPNRSVDSRVEVLTEIARVQGDELRQVELAISTLDQALAQTPSSKELRIELVSRLRTAGNNERALGELKRLLAMDVTRAETWRDLTQVYKALGRTAESELACAPLVALGAANDLERATLSSRPSRMARAQSGAFDAAAYRALDEHGGADAANELLAALAEGLAKVHPPELERYGLSSRDRITTRWGNTRRLLADHIARVWGVEEFDLSVHRAHAGSLEGELTAPPAVLVPATVTQLSEIEQGFLLARPLSNIARRLHAVNRLSPREIELLLVAATRSVDPSFAVGIADEEFLVAHAKKVQKSLSRRGRKAVEDAAQLYVGAARVDFTELSERIRRSAARAAVVLADDLPACVTLIRRTEGDLAGLRGQALAQGMELAADLMRFWISDASATLRRRMGY